jgi:hypothetical protein
MFGVDLRIAGAPCSHQALETILDCGRRDGRCDQVLVVSTVVVEPYFEMRGIEGAIREDPPH